MMQQLGFTARDIFEERTDRCQPRVPASRAVAAFILAEGQEPPDDAGIDVGYMQLSRGGNLISAVAYFNKRRKVSR